MIGRSDGGLADANYDDSQANITNVESPARDVQSFSLPLEQYSSSPDDMMKQLTMPAHTVTPSPSEGLPASERASSSEYLSKRGTMPSVAPAAAPPSPQQLRVSENKKEANECIVNRPCTTSSRSAAGSRKGSSGGASRNTSGSSSSSSGGSSSSSGSSDNESDRITIADRLHNPSHGHPGHPSHHTHPSHHIHPSHPAHRASPANPSLHPSLHPNHPGDHTQPGCPSCHVTMDTVVMLRLDSEMMDEELKEILKENSFLHEALALCQAVLGNQHRVTKLHREELNSIGAMLDGAKRNLKELTAAMEKLQNERDTQTGGTGGVRSSQHSSPSLQASLPPLNAEKARQLPSRSQPYPASRSAYKQLPRALSASPQRSYLRERISTPPPLQALNYESEDDHSHMYSRGDAVSPPSQARRAPISMQLPAPSPPAAHRPHLSLVPSATMDYCERVSPVHTIDEVPLEVQRELREFAAKFKERRLSLRLTQAEVGQTSIGQIGTPDFGQSTISRFEKLTLSYENMMKLRPYIERWMSLSDHEVLSICSPATAAISSSAASGRVNAENNNPAANRSDMDMAQSSVVPTAVAPQDLQPAGSIANQVQPKNVIPVTAGTHVCAMPVQAAHDPESHHGQLHRHQHLKYQHHKEQQQNYQQHHHQHHPHPVHNSREAAAEAQQSVVMEGMHIAAPGYSTDYAQQPVVMEGMHIAAPGYSTDYAQQPFVMEGMHIAAPGYSTYYAKARHQPQNPHSHHAQPSSSNPHPVTYYRSGQGVLTADGHSARMIPVADIRTPSNSMLTIPAHRKKKRRLVLDQDRRKYLEESFGVQPRPLPEDLRRIAHMLNLEKEEVRVWFCNRRQKEKQLTGAGPQSRHQSAHMDLEPYDGNVGGDGAGGAENTPGTLLSHSCDTHHSPEA
ncbi:protein nubbin-like [Sycon ciliatum]|uniref:protein nubbin-like n=1 Tax=Sycon ciliatum TaxID=27933 RepID=UPI0031F717C7